MLVIVTAPVPPETDIPVPATLDVTPVFVSVIEPLLVSGLPDTDRPPPLVIPTLDKRLLNLNYSGNHLYLHLLEKLIWLVLLFLMKQK